MITKYLFFLFSLTCTGQVYHIGYKNDDPSPKDFPAGKDTLDIYEYTFTDGKIKDSALYKHLVYDRKANVISFTKKIDESKPYRPEYIPCDNFMYQYDSIYRVIFKDESRLKKYNTGEFLFVTKKEKNSYNGKNIITHNIIRKQIWYDLKGNDTIWSSIIIDKKSYEFSYNNTLFIDYQTIQDFTGLYNFENGVIKDSAIYSYPKYLNNKYFYDNDGKVVSGNTYARDNQIMSKTFYKYDHHNRLKKEYLVTGLYNNGKPKRSLSRKYRYKKDGSKKEIWYIGGGSIDITIYDSKENHTGFKRYNDGKLENNDRNEYFYEKGKLVKTTQIDKDKQLIAILYKYNKQEFLVEEQIITPEDENIIRYYYK